MLPTRAADFLSRLVVVAGLLAGADSGRAAPPAPNILLIMADDLGAEWLSCYGSRDLQTPHIDALAAAGMRFTSAWSMPKCTPTRVTLLTGQYPFRHGWVNHWDVPRWGDGCHFDPAHNDTFAGVARAAGLATAIAGKWQINDFRIDPDVLDKIGFDEWCMWTGYEEGNPRSANRYADPYVHANDGSRTHEGRFGPDVYTDFLVDFMKRHRDRPMLLYYPMALPHGPLTSTPRRPQAEGKAEQFAAMVDYVDHCVGRLVAALNELGIRDRTYVLFTTDNGTGGGLQARRGDRVVRGGKGKMLESGVNAPFIVTGPDVPAGTVTDALTDFTDISPTIAELVGGPSSFAGKRGLAPCSPARSLGPVLRDPGRPGRPWILAMGGGTARFVDGRVVPARPYADRVLRTGRFKLWIVDGASARLHDLRADPDEQVNLIDSADPEAAAARWRLEAVVATFPDRDASPRYDPLPRQAWEHSEDDTND